MAISGQQFINIGAQNQPANSDSLYIAFNKIQNNFTTLFDSSSTYVNFVGNLGIDATSNLQSGTVTITNTGVTKLTPGTGITLSGSNGNITVSVSGNVSGALVAGVTNVAVVSDSLIVENSPIVSSGNIKVNLPKQTNVIADTYIAPTITVNDYGVITDIQSIESVGTVTSVALSAGNGIAVVGGPITSSGTMTIYNTGVTQLKSGPGITLSGSNGIVTVSAGLDRDVGTVTRIGISSNSLFVTGGSITTSGNITVELPDDLFASGNIVSNNKLTVNGQSYFGNVTNVHISGGTSGYVLQTDGTGNLSWVAQTGGTPGAVAATGSNTQIQFNDAGVLGAHTNLTYNKTNGTLNATLFNGSGANLTNVPAGNVTGNLVNANITYNMNVGGNANVTGNVVVNGTLRSGAITSVTATAGTNNTMVATTEFVTAAINATKATQASLVSPLLTGVPQAPTASILAPSSNQVATLAYVKDYVNSATTAVTAAAVAVPAGGIIMWSGLTSSIPSGWRLCDGNYGTPDLRGRFIIGAGGTYNVQSQGGSADAVVINHTHTASSTFTGSVMGTHSHGIIDPGHGHAVIDPGHTHNVNNQTAEGPQWIAFSRGDLTPYGATNNANGYGVNQTTGDDRIFTIVTNRTGVAVSSGTTNTSVLAGTAGTPTGTVATTLSSTGTGGTGLNLPPYYALCFIMKT